jgi:predicted adenylyl cyclase CyaB
MHFLISRHACFQKLLSTTNEIVGEVKKTRYLFIYDQTRIHVDEVEGLGSYMELEVCLRDDETLEYGAEAAEKIMKELGIQKSSLITGAYMDALNTLA